MTTDPTPLSRLRTALVVELLDRWPRDPQDAPMLAAWEADRMAPRIGRALSSAGLVLADAVPVPPVDATDRRCGTCRHFRPVGPDASACWWRPERVPHWYGAHVMLVHVRGFGGRDCNTWEARDDGR